MEFIGMEKYTYDKLPDVDSFQFCGDIRNFYPSNLFAFL